MREPAQAPRPVPPRPVPAARTPGARPARLIAPLVALAMLPPGWIFIADQHRWHLTPPVVVLCLAWAAVVGAGWTLVRASNLLLDEVPDDWFVTGSNRDELEREKKSLVRAIKEIEFDRDTGKLTAADAAQLIVAYRARAIEVIKAIDIGAVAMTPRERIMAEIKARALVDRKVSNAKAKAAKAAKPGKAAPPPVAEVKPAAVEAAVDEAAVDQAAADDAAAVDATAATVEASAPSSHSFAAPPGVDEVRGSSPGSPSATSEEVAS